ncbi:MAG: hypothetical protein AAF492_15955, partial [Verrucomicrobiota bacterium]
EDFKDRVYDALKFMVKFMHHRMTKFDYDKDREEEFEAHRWFKKARDASPAFCDHFIKATEHFTLKFDLDACLKDRFSSLVGRVADLLRS